MNVSCRFCCTDQRFEFGMHRSHLGKEALHQFLQKNHVQEASHWKRLFAQRIEEEEEEVNSFLRRVRVAGRHQEGVIIRRMPRSMARDEVASSSQFFQRRRIGHQRWQSFSDRQLGVSDTLSTTAHFQRLRTRTRARTFLHVWLKMELRLNEPPRSDSEPSLILCDRKKVICSHSDLHPSLA